MDKSLGLDVYEQIKRRILAWEYLPGQRLTEEGLCAEFHVSRSPVREALNMLVEGNLVVKNPRSKYAVRSLDLREIEDAYEVRLVLELEVVARLCRTGADPSLLDRLEARWTELREGLPDLSAHATAEDESFHRSLAEATGNLVLVRALGMIESHIHFVRQSDITSVERLRRTCGDHLEILEALRRRDLKNAVAAMMRNIEWARSNVEKAYAQAMARAGGPGGGAVEGRP